ncbi:MAG: chorismate mutase, partial [Acidobacteria bacterium]|nr:chorismate mutase [Acidobacteriota bacterium]
KRLARLEVYEPRREDSVLANAASGNRGPLSNEALRRIFERILEEMRAVQRRQIEAGECKP